MGAVRLMTSASVYWKPRPPWHKHPLLILFALFLVLPFLMVQLGSTISMANEILIFSVLILGFNILLGYTGLLSFGHGAFYGLGAYFCGLAQIHFFRGMVILPILSGILGATLIGVILAYLLMRKRGVYFSLLTFAFTMMFFYIVFRATAITGGENGLGGIERYPLNLLIVKINLANQLAFYYFSWVWVVLATILIWRIVHSPFGRVLQAIRENEVRTFCLGYNPKQYKFMAFVFSALFGGLAGALYTLLLNFAYPQTLHVVTSGEIAAMALVGGMRNFFRPRGRIVNLHLPPGPAQLLYGKLAGFLRHYLHGVRSLLLQWDRGDPFQPHRLFPKESRNSPSDSCPHRKPGVYSRYRR